MASALPLDWSRIVLRGIASGIVGGLLIGLFIYFTNLAPHHAGILGLWQFIASSAFGTLAYSSTGFAWVGLTMHALVSIGWGVGYSYLSQTQQAVNKTPIISGLVFGLTVYVVMQLALATVGLLKITSGMQVVLAIVAHTFFFGLPVALVNDWQRPRLP